MAQVLVTAMTIIGAVLTLGGLGWGARRLVFEHRELVAALAEVRRIDQDDSLTVDEQTAQKEAALPHTSSWADVEYIREWVRRFILEQALSNLRWPAALTATGVVLSTVASVWGVWV